MNGGDRIRILHLVPPMRRAGIETWLMHVLRHIDRRRFHMDFMVQTDQPCDYDEEIRALGSKVIPCPRTRRPLRCARQIRSGLRQYGPYDVVHSHLYHFNGFVLRLAARAGVGVRIAHSHTDMRVVDATASLPRRAYVQLMQRWIDRYATERIACSEQAGLALFGAPRRGRPSWQVIPCGLNFEAFDQGIDRVPIRAELGIPEHARVIGHVGRFEEEKNHRFLMEIMTEVAQRDPTVYLLLLGEGSLRAQVEADVARRGLQDRVVFAGVRADVPRLLRGALDGFVLPSRYEGLALAAVEAQAAGLPCLLADTLPPEADLVPGLVRRLPLGEAARWAATLVEMVRQPRAVDADEALSIVRRSPFNIRNTLEALERVYEGVPAIPV